MAKRKEEKNVPLQTIRLQIARPEESTMLRERIIELPQANRLRIHCKEDNGRHNSQQRRIKSFRDTAREHGGLNMRGSLRLMLDLDVAFKRIIWACITGKVTSSPAH